MDANAKRILIIVLAVLAVGAAAFIGMRTIGEPPLEKGNVIPHTGPRLSDIEKQGMNTTGGSPPSRTGGSTADEPGMGGAVGNRR